MGDISHWSGRSDNSLEDYYHLRDKKSKEQAAEKRHTTDLSILQHLQLIGSPVAGGARAENKEGDDSHNNSLVLEKEEEEEDDDDFVSAVDTFFHADSSDLSSATLRDFQSADDFEWKVVSPSPPPKAILARPHQLSPGPFLRKLQRPSYQRSSISSKGSNTSSG